MAEIKSSNPKAFEKLEVALNALAGFQAKVGWFPGAVYEDGTPVAYVATIQEYGSAKRSIPPRPFMRPTIAENEAKWKANAAIAAKRILNGSAQPKHMMELLAAQAEGDVRKSIENVTSPPLSPITLALRKYKQMYPERKITGATVGMVAGMLKRGEIDIGGVPTKPLDDSHHMIATLTHVVESAS